MSIVLKISDNFSDLYLSGIFLYSPVTRFQNYGPKAMIQTLTLLEDIN